MVLLPAQIVRSGRKIVYRIMRYNRWLKRGLHKGSSIRPNKHHLSRMTGRGRYGKPRFP